MDTKEMEDELVIRQGIKIPLVHSQLQVKSRKDE